MQDPSAKQSSTARRGGAAQIVLKWLWLASLGVGVLFIVIGLVAIQAAWNHLDDPDRAAPFSQNQEILSGGFAGLGLLALGAGFLVSSAVLGTGERILKSHAGLVDALRRTNEALVASPRPESPAAEDVDLESMPLATGSTGPKRARPSRRAPT